MGVCQWRWAGGEGGGRPLAVGVSRNSHTHGTVTTNTPPPPQHTHTHAHTQQPTDPHTHHTLHFPLLTLLPKTFELWVFFGLRKLKVREDLIVCGTGLTAMRGNVRQASTKDYQCIIIICPSTCIGTPRHKGDNRFSYLAFSVHQNGGHRRGYT